MMCEHTYRKEESTDCAYKTWGVLLVPELGVSVLCAPDVSMVDDIPW